MDAGVMQQRIEQFRNMTEADPENEMGHFSLGKAYIDAGQLAEAVAPLQRALELNPTYSKAYQLLAEALKATGDTSAALDTLMTGFKVADERGDRMPRDAMGKLIVELGQTPPETKGPAQPEVPAGEVTDENFVCTRCGRPGGRLPDRPFKGELGQVVWDRICMVCWREWIGVGTKVINELGLSLADPRAQQIYDDNMREFLQLEE